MKKHAPFSYLSGFFVLALLLFTFSCGDDIIYFVIVGGVSGTPDVHAGIIYTSEDGTTWDTSSNVTTGDSSLNKVTYWHDRFVVVGSAQGAYYSEDGSTWNRGNIFGCIVFLDVAGGEVDTYTGPWTAYYVIVGNAGKAYFSTSGGVDWTAASDTKTNAQLNAVAFGKVMVQGYQVSRFVAVGKAVSDNVGLLPQAVIIWSSDGGDTWFHHSAGGTSYDLEGVAFGNGRFVAVGPGGTVLYSDNGAGWTEAVPASDAGDYLMDAAWGLPVWTAVGSYGTVWYSVDGAQTWQYGNCTATSFSFSDVLYAGDKFMAVGYNTSGEGAVIESADGISWTLVKTFGPSQYYYTGIAYKPE